METVSSNPNPINPTNPTTKLPTLMTLNDLERRNSPYFAFFSPNSTYLQADYITVVEDRRIMP